jgi:hypothetical protein
MQVSPHALPAEQILQHCWAFTLTRENIEGNPLRSASAATASRKNCSAVISRICPEFVEGGSADATSVVIENAIKTTTESIATIRRVARKTKSARFFSMNPPAPIVLSESKEASRSPGRAQHCIASDFREPQFDDPILSPRSLSIVIYR